ncbi:hypothetical protein ACYZUC_04405 [Pseudomonas sp. GT1P32]
MNKKNTETTIHLAGSERKKQNKNEVPAFTGDWGAVSAHVYDHQHVRVPELKGKIEYQYFYQNGYLYVHMSKYMLTSRPTNKVWRRANIYLNVSSGSNNTTKVESPDTLIMDHQWHSEELVAAVKYNWAAGGAGFVFGVQYDGTNNDVGSNEKWGPFGSIIL